MKKILLMFVGILCSLVTMADDVTLGITRTIASSETTTDKSTSGAAVTGRAVSNDIVVDDCDDVIVAIAHKLESDMTDKARNTYWFNGSSIKCYVDKGVHNYRNSTKELSNDNYFAFTLTIAQGKALNIKSINGDIMMDGDNTPYQMAIVNADGTEVYTSQTKNGKKSESAAKSVAVTDLAEEIQAALTGMTGTVTVKMRWTNTANTGKYCVIKDFNVVAEVVDAGAQTQYTKPTITVGAYNQSAGTYAVTLNVQNDEDGTINYTVGDADKVTDAASGTVINVAPNTTIAATVSGSSYDESDEQSTTTPTAPKLNKPTNSVGAFNFTTSKYSVTLGCDAGAHIWYRVAGGDWTSYSAAFEATAGALVEAQAKQNNMTASDVLSFNLPAAPKDGTHTIPTDGSEQYTSGTSYNAGAYTIAANPTYLGGIISSSKSSINGSIKMRLSRNADPVDFNSEYGFHLDVNPGYTITDVTVKILNNYETDINATGIYVDDEITTNLLASPINLPSATSSSVQPAVLEANGIFAKNRIVFTFAKNSGEDNPNQGQVLITVKYIVPVYNANVTPDGFGTMYYEKELVCPAETEAYTATLNGTTLKLNKLEDGVIPANTPVVIKGNGGLFTLGTSGAEAVVSDLKGTATTVATSSIEGGTVCVLGYVDEQAGFYKYTGANLGANKAYLVVPSENAVKGGISIVFDDDATAADVVEAATEQNVEVKKFFVNGQLLIQTANGLVNAAGAQVK